MDLVHFALREGDSRFCEQQVDKGGECCYDGEADSFGLDSSYNVGERLQCEIKYNGSQSKYASLEVLDEPQTSDDRGRVFFDARWNSTGHVDGGYCSPNLSSSVFRVEIDKDEFEFDFQKKEKYTLIYKIR